MSRLVRQIGEQIGREKGMELWFNSKLDQNEAKFMSTEIMSFVPTRLKDFI